MGTIVLRQQQVLYDQKWRKFLRRAWLFQYIPFVDFVFGGGSLATGTVSTDSDFDVVIGAKQGRIFTVRILCALAFGVPGWRRSKMDHRESASDKVCLNHFVTPSAYRATFATNEYFANLYRRLVPLYGSRVALQTFLDANQEWLGEVKLSYDSRHRWETKSALAVWLERVLSGPFGSWCEQKAKVFQVKRIERSLPTVGFPGKQGTLPPLIVYGDNELKFHPDPLEL